MKIKRKQKPVIIQELDSGATQTKYKKIIWLLFLTILTAGGILAGLQISWGSLAPSVTGEIASAAAGIAVCILAELTKERIRFSWIFMLLPWPVLFLLEGFQSCWIGARAWINVLIGRWNAVNEGGAGLFTVHAGQADIRAFTIAATLAVTEIVWLLVIGRQIILANVIAVAWLLVQFLCAVSDPFACGLLIAGLSGLWITGRNQQISRRGVVWTAGILAVFLVFAGTVSSGTIEAVDAARESVQQKVHEMRYGEDTLPEGNLYAAEELQNDGNEMLSIGSEQQKTMYLRGFVGASYTDGVWEPLSDSAYGGDYTGLLKWLSDRGFDPLTQVSTYYKNCAEEERPENNQLSIRVSDASRYYVYTPASLTHVPRSQMSEKKDYRLMSRGLIGIASYTMDELSGSRPAELMVTADWVSNPTTDEQKQYLEAEAAYRAFVYDTYRTVDADTVELMKTMFWDDYKSDSDGIYSAVCQIRNVLKDTVEYTENPEKTPDDKDPVQYFLTESQKGNSMLYASVAVDALRVHGIPARYVEGYYISASDMKDNGGSLNLTGQNAHAWAEVYFDGIGWLPLDVTPGYYYDAVTLQKMVSAPDNVQKNAVLNNDAQSSEQVTGLENSGKKNLREKIEPVVRNVTAIILGVIAVFMILLVFSIAVAELLRIILLRKEQKDEKNMTQKVRVLRNEKKIYTYLALLGIHARLGWNTAETDRILTERFKGLEEGEYIRVCDLIEKVIYGDIELEPYEERTVDGFLNKILSDTKVLNWKTRLKRRYVYVWKCRK